MKLKRLKGKMWAYFAPDGYLQVRSIAHTRRLARESISKFESYNWQDYERAGYALQRILVEIKIIEENQ